jgi:hypothetical protein
VVVHPLNLSILVYMASMWLFVQSSTQPPHPCVQGEQVVVSSTGYTAEQAEVRTITAVTPAVRSGFKGSLVTVSKPFTYFHYGLVQYFKDPKKKTWRLDERAQVGMLNRNIVIQVGGFTNFSIRFQFQVQASAISLQLQPYSFHTKCMVH